MPLNNGQVAVGTVATLIPSRCIMPSRMEIHNDDNSDDLFIGGPGVTVATGMRVNKLEQLDLRLAAMDEVYAVSTKTGHDLSYIHFRQC